MMQFSHAALGVALLAALSTVAACDRNAKKAASAEARTVDACAMVTKADVEAALGKSFEEGQHSTPITGGRGVGRNSNCSYMSLANPTLSVGAQLDDMTSVTVQVWTWTTSDGAEAYLRSMELAPLKPLQPIDGLGERAVWTGALHARQADASVTISISRPAGLDDQANISASTSLMRHALERLKT